MASPAVLYQAGVHGSRPANGSGCVLYSCTTHDLVYRDDGTSWTTFMTLVGGAAGDVATDPIWDAAGDLAVGSGANTAARLPVGSNGEVLTLVAGTPSWEPASSGVAPDGVTLTRAAVQAIAQNTAVPVSWSASVVEDDADYWDIGTPTIIVVQHTGWHAMAAKWRWAAQTTGRRNGIISINGDGNEDTYWNSSRHPASDHNDPFQTVTGFEKLTAGDTIEFEAKQNQVANLNISVARCSVMFMGS